MNYKIPVLIILTVIYLFKMLKNSCLLQPRDGRIIDLENHVGASLSLTRRFYPQPFKCDVSLTKTGGISSHVSASFFLYASTA